MADYTARPVPRSVRYTCRVAHAPHRYSAEAVPISSYIPKHIANPFALAIDLFKSGDRAAIDAMWLAAGGIAAWPLDYALRGREQSLRARAGAPQRPLILVAGAPRSGTSLLARVLIRHLHVAYPTNLASLFPHAPVSAMRMFGTDTAPDGGDTYATYYGRSRGLAGPNDALFVWDRWLGPDRSKVPASIDPAHGGDMQGFFAALQALHGLPAVNKVNRLLGCAELIAALLPTAHFVLLRRDPVYLAQSLLRAREQITRNPAVAYGEAAELPMPEDPLEDTCRQVEHYAAQLVRQQAALPEHRCTVVDYEAFCAAPGGTVTALQRQYPQLQARPGVADEIEPFEVSRAQRLPSPVFERIKRRLG